MSLKPGVASVAIAETHIAGEGSDAAPGAHCLPD